MTGATGTPPTTPTQATTKDTKTVQGGTGSTAGATTDLSQPATVRTTGTGQSAAEKALDTERPAPEKILEASPPATATSAPTMASGSRIETATTIPGGTGSSQMGMGGVVEPSLPQGAGVGGSSQTTASNTITIGSDTSQDRQDRGEWSDNLTETASRYGRDMGRRTSEAYEQGLQGVSAAAGQAWDTAQRTAGQVRRQSSRGLSSAQSVLVDNPLVGIMVGAAVGAMVGYLIGHRTASTRTIDTRRYDDRDEFGETGYYPGSYGGSYSSSSRYPDGSPRTDIHRYADRVRYSDGD
jgi:ElaB/YqjD/DUF883 family membrane-anchored ribosome-binding protein